MSSKWIGDVMEALFQTIGKSQFQLNSQNQEIYLRKGINYMFTRFAFESGLLFDVWRQLHWMKPESLAHANSNHFHNAKLWKRSESKFMRESTNFYCKMWDTEINYSISKKPLNHIEKLCFLICYVDQQ